jgi:hypothetical protein
MKGNLYTENEKLKKKINIGRTFYKIYICDCLRFRNKKYYGFIDYDRKEIFLLKDKDLKETLMHEITHAFLNELYKKTKRQDILKLRSDENFINYLSLFLSKNFKF